MDRAKSLIKTAFSCLFFLAVATTVQAQESDPHFIGPLPQEIAPEWASSSNYYFSSDERVNSLIGDLTTLRTLSLIPREFQVTPISEGQAHILNQKYNDLLRAYEEKEKWSTLTQLEREQRNEAIRGFMSGLRNEIQAQQFVQRRDSLLKMIPQKKLLAEAEKIPKPVLAVAAVAGAVMTGSTLDLHLIPQAQMKAQLDLINQRSQVSLLTPIVDANVNVRGQNVGNTDLNAPPPSEYPAKSYRYEVSVSKSVPELALSTGVSYISMSESMRASVSKVIAPNLTAEVGTYQPLNPNNRLQPREESVKLQYGMQF